MIARSGKDLSTLKTRQQVHDQFGEPVTTGISDGEHFEDYHTHQKISDELESISLSMGLEMSFGLGEFVAFPYELYGLGRKTIIGQDVRFHYDSAGNVTGRLLDHHPSRILEEHELPPYEPEASATDSPPSLTLPARKPASVADASGS